MFEFYAFYEVLMNLKKKIFWLTDNSYAFFMIFAFLSFYYNVPGVLRQALWVLLFILNLKYVKIESQMDKIVMFYFLSSLLTLSGNIIIPYPLGNFIKVFIYSYVPVIFYFIGKYRYSEYTTFMNRSNIGIMFLFILGFYFLLFPTDIYITKSLEALNLHGHYTEDTLELARFSSFMDSYHTANLGICSLCFSFGLLKYSNISHFKRPNFMKFVSILFIVISLVAILLARQRVAMYIGFLIFAYFLFNCGLKKRIIFAIVVPLIIGGVCYLMSSIDDVFLEQITKNFSKKASSTLFSDRSNQWLEAIDGFCQAPLCGLGVGSSGHVALMSNPNHPIVTDGSFFKILVEGGIITFIPFVLILGFSFLKAYKYRRKYYIECPLLFFFGCSLLGANVIDMPYIILFMWYIIGRINSKNSYAYE